MNSVQETVEAFTEFLQTGPTPLAKGTIVNYACIIRNTLEESAPEDLTDPQMLIYLRAVANDSYRGAFSSAWKAFTQFCDIYRDVELPRVPEIRKIHFIHPIEPDLRVLLLRYYDGLPVDLDWQKLVETEKDQKFLRAAQRCY